jgi:hypothetical protein
MALRLGQASDVIGDFGEEVPQAREGELRLRLGRTRREDSKAALPREVHACPPEGRLPDPGLAFEEQKLRPLRRLGDQLLYLGEFALPSDELFDPCRCHLLNQCSAGVGRRQARYDRPVAEQQDKPLNEQLEEIGSRLAWVRDYL